MVSQLPGQLTYSRFFSALVRMASVVRAGHPLHFAIRFISFATIQNGRSPQRECSCSISSAVHLSPAIMLLINVEHVVDYIKAANIQQKYKQWKKEKRHSNSG
jgi:hypothetical protein